MYPRILREQVAAPLGSVEHNLRRTVPSDGLVTKLTEPCRLKCRHVYADPIYAQHHHVEHKGIL